MKKIIDHSFYQLVERLPAGIMIYQDGRFAYLNRAALNLMGAASLDQVIGMSVLDFIHPDSRPAIMQRMQRVSAGEKVPSVDERVLRVDGSEYRAEITSTLVEYENRPAVQVMFQDVTWRYVAAETIARQESLLRSLIDIVPAYIMVIGAEDLRYRYVNSAFEHSFGLQRSEIEGALMKDIIGEANFTFALPYIEKTRQGTACSYENSFEFRDKVGKRWAKVMYSPGFAADGHVETLIVLGIDITEMKTIEMTLRKREKELLHANIKLEELSQTDGLTQIYNRSFFDMIYKRKWQEYSRLDLPISVIMIDVDHFKKYNDLYGHQQGDVCLYLLAKALKRQLSRSSDILSRYGGEEFVVIVCSDQGHAYKIAEKMRISVRKLGLRHESSDKEIVTISIGVASAIPSGRVKAPELVRRADEALYESKKNGRDRVTVHNTEPSATEEPSAIKEEPS